MTTWIKYIRPESMNHRKNEITITVTTTTMVKLVTSSLDGQVTFLNSSLDSRTYVRMARIFSRILSTIDLRFRFLVSGMLVAELAELLNFKLTGLVLLVLGHGIIFPLTILTCQQYDFTHILFPCL